jgi:PII-like signaling protein
VSSDALKLTVYHGERDRVGDRFLADALGEVFARFDLRVSVVMRGAAGFGPAQHLRTDRLLTLSEDLPVVSAAVDERERIEAVLGEVRAIAFSGLVTLERVRLVSGAAAELEEQAKLTVYAGRGGRVHQRLVEVLHRHGVAGASVLLGVDGTTHGIRRRGRFLSGNADVPLMVVSVGAGDRLAAAVPELAALAPEAVITAERVRICKRDGVRLADPEVVSDMRQILTVYGADLVPPLLDARPAGATSLRGIWGYHGDHAPHGDVMWQLRRRVPSMTVVVDDPAAIRDRVYPAVDALTESHGLVTTELARVVLAGDGR